VHDGPRRRLGHVAQQGVAVVVGVPRGGRQRDEAHVGWLHVARVHPQHVGVQYLRPDPAVQTAVKAKQWTAAARSRPRPPRRPCTRRSHRLCRGRGRRTPTARCRSRAPRSTGHAGRRPPGRSARTTTARPGGSLTTAHCRHPSARRTARGTCRRIRGTTASPRPTHLRWGSEARRARRWCRRWVPTSTPVIDLHSAPPSAANAQGKMGGSTKRQVSNFRTIPWDTAFHAAQTQHTHARPAASSAPASGIAGTRVGHRGRTLKRRTKQTNTRSSFVFGNCNTQDVGWVGLAPFDRRMLHTA
jgi:hypothetical protein